MAGAQGESSGERQGPAERRMLRSRYLAMKNLISGRAASVSLVRPCSRGFGSISGLG
jgi:hypothetical protein